MLTTEFNILKDFHEYVSQNSDVAADATEVAIEGRPVITVNWQGGSGQEKTGAFIEEVLAVAYAQLSALNKEFPCRENSVALTKIEEAVLWLAQRKAEREHRGVYGKDEK